ncbi:hypothetical protein [Bacillus thuringiensis]|uniref:hypothetical protein n=1 Tax=Bacillus thuringiensis TaxID=1428 RepID=UPI003459C447
MTTKNEEYVNARRRGYTVTDNGMHDDKKLTLQAKGLLGIFLSNKDDWKINMKEIITRSKNGRDAHYKVVNELIANEYFARVEIRKDNRYYKMLYIFSDIKEDVAHKLSQLLPKYTAEGCTYNVEYGEKAPLTENQETAISVSLPENQETENQVTENQYNNNTKGNILKNNNPKEEEEYNTSLITELVVTDMMNDIIKQREITNEKTIKAILSVSNKCKAIGTTDLKAAENFVIMVVEEKMGKLGQKQKAKQPKSTKRTNGTNKPVRKELVPEWVGEETPQEEAPKTEENEFMNWSIEDLETRKAQLQILGSNNAMGQAQLKLVEHALNSKQGK